MAGHRNRIGAAAIAFAALGLAAVSAWILLGDPARKEASAARHDVRGGTRDARASGADPSAVLDPRRNQEIPGGPLPGMTGPGGDPASGGTPGNWPGPGHAAPGSPPAEDHATDEERQERDRLTSGMAKLMRDLEFSPGLKEPPQQLVQPQPDPWKRDPSREGPSPVVDAVEPRRGRTAGGDRVVLRGRNLRVVEVMFGATPGHILGATGALVTVATPPSAAGPVKIAVTNDDGTWAIAAEPFVYGD